MKLRILALNCPLNTKVMRVGGGFGNGSVRANDDKIAPIHYRHPLLLATVIEQIAVQLVDRPTNWQVDLQPKFTIFA